MGDQGGWWTWFGPSGDGYTRRTDDILSTTPEKPGMVDMEKIVDDILIWSNTMEEAFFRICNILSHAGEYGMVFCPKKFCFAKEEVEFAGLVVGKDGIRPTDQYKQAILDQGGIKFEISWEPNFPVDNFARNNGKTRVIIETIIIIKL